MTGPATGPAPGSATGAAPDGPTDPGEGPEVLRLSPTEDLLIDLLVARRRLGYHLQQVPTRHRKALARLADLGLIGYDGGNIDRHQKVWLTEAGIVYGMDPTLVVPALDPICRSYYLGPKTGESRVDCARRNHHKGKHRAGWVKRKQTKQGAVQIVETTVRWDDTQAGGLASDRYGEELRAHAEQRAARIAEARRRFGVPTPDPAENPQF